jgi:hypothetical protein
LSFYYRQWKLFLHSQQRLKKWIASHLATVQSFPPILKPIDVPVMAPAEPCLTTPNAIAICSSHKTCRCVRCLSRYGHLGAKTRQSYNQSPMNMNRFSSPINTPLSKSRLGRESLDRSFNSVISEDVRSRYPQGIEEYRDDSFLSRDDQNPFDIALQLNPPIVVIESTCTVTDHLKVISLSYTCSDLLCLP